jgi:regulator of nucleoside diphosphate kinase
MNHTLPAITISSLDMDRLDALLEKLPVNFPGRETLEAELLRADVLEPQDMPSDVVTMNSTVRFTLVQSGVSQTLTLVYPKEADGSAHKVSVFAPAGTALLGLRVGDVLSLPQLQGQTISVRVDAITYQPESAGQMHR